MLAAVLTLLLAITLALPVYAEGVEPSPEPPSVQTEDPSGETLPDKGLPETPPDADSSETPPDEERTETPPGQNQPSILEPDANKPSAADLCFSLSEERAGQGQVLMGVLSGIDDLRDLQAQSALPYYSLDGVTYFHPCAENPEMAESRDWVKLGGGTLSRTCFAPEDEPYKSFLDGTIDRFYVRLHIMGGPYEGDTAAALLERADGMPQPLPEGFTVYPLRYPGSMRVSFRGPNQYCVTVRQGASEAELRALLPETLELESQIDASTGYPFPVDAVRCAVTWDLTEIRTDAPGETTAANAAVCTPPPFATATINQSSYTYTPKRVETALNLVVTVVEQTASQFQLEREGQGLCFSMTKPSGAEAYQGEYSLDGGETWLAGERLALDDETVNQAPKQKTFSAPTGFTEDQSPMKELADGVLEGFYVRIRIFDGALDGYTQPAVWPGTYQYVPTPDVDDNGGGGNKGNAGSKNSGEDSAGSGGQRPGLSEETSPAEESPIPAPVPTPDPVVQEPAAPPPAEVPAVEQTSLREEKPTAQADSSVEKHAGTTPAPLPETLAALIKPAEPAPIPPAMTDGTQESDEEAAPAAAVVQSAEEKPERASASITPAATVAAVVLLGGGSAAAVSAATASAASAAGTSAGAGGLAKLLRALRGLLRR